MRTLASVPSLFSTLVNITGRLEVTAADPQKARDLRYKEFAL